MNKTLPLFIFILFSVHARSQVVASAATKFTGSMNADGILNSQSKTLQYNPDVKTITFVHKKAPGYVPSFNGNSNSIVVAYSINKGASWDTSCIWTNTVALAGVPQGVLYNPAGNTNYTNAYIVGCGPTATSGLWSGNWYASKKLTNPGNNTPGTDLQSFPNTAPFGTIGKKFDLAENSITYTKDGLVRSIGLILNNPNSPVNSVSYGIRGTAIIKGTFSAGSFVWTYDSLVPATMTRSNATKYLDNQPLMAWNDAGTVGYIVMLGVAAGASTDFKSYQPLVYKTSNSGASWSLLPQDNFTTYGGVMQRIRSINSSTCVSIPHFSSNEGWDATVDVNNNLHIACTVLGSKSLHPDSLDQTFSFGTEQYNFRYYTAAYPTGAFGFPTIYDFYTTSSGSWNYMIVDSMGSEFCPGYNSSAPGYTYNPWTSGTGGKYDINARIQMSHSEDRKKIFYSWTATDSVVTGFKWNIYPDIFMRGFDVTIDKKTPRFNVTGGVLTPVVVDQEAYFHFMSPTAIGSATSTTYEIPVSLSNNLTFAGNTPIDHIYLQGITFAQSHFTLNPFSGGGSAGNCPLSVMSIPSGNDHLFLYPVPSTGAVNLVNKSNTDIRIINVYNSLGQSFEIKNQAKNANEISLDLSNYPKGFYFMDIIAGDKKITKRFVLE